MEILHAPCWFTEGEDTLGRWWEGLYNLTSCYRNGDPVGGYANPNLTPPRRNVNVYIYNIYIYRPVNDHNIIGITPKFY